MKKRLLKNAMLRKRIWLRKMFLRNSGKLSFVPYTKDFGRITRF